MHKHWFTLTIVIGLVFSLTVVFAAYRWWTYDPYVYLHSPPANSSIQILELKPLPNSATTGRTYTTTDPQLLAAFKSALSANHYPSNPNGMQVAGQLTYRINYKSGPEIVDDATLHLNANEAWLIMYYPEGGITFHGANDIWVPLHTFMSAKEIANLNKFKVTIPDR